MGASVCAVVVTHNRSALLRTCLDKLAAQHRAPERVLVVDNASTDGTAALVRAEYPETELLSLEVNEGGAGGFHEGMKRAYETGCEWLWLLDDDTFAEPSALAELLGAADRLTELPAPTLLASVVLWRDGTPHPMNFPTVERRRMRRVIAAVQRGLMPIRTATFVSLLVHRSLVERHGLPLKYFFLWSDDIEYTSRAVLSGELGLLVPTSVVVHETVSAADFRSAPPDRFYYHARNTLFMARGPQRPPRDRLLRYWIFVSTSVAYLLRHPNLASAAAVTQALWDGVRDPSRTGGQRSPRKKLSPLAGRPPAAR
jgi:rhamnopyranosyl-N-acetylglucosaminyl-diphospho-decaprenol beta-1,3/1,4-galactofuranosyltransferase